MPILEVDFICPDESGTSSDLARRIADSAAGVFGSSPGETWVRLNLVPRSRYAENEGGPPEGVLPVIVRVLKRRSPRGPSLASEVEALTEAIAKACGRPPENVHLIYAPDAEGRVAFGGRIVGL